MYGQRQGAANDVVVDGIVDGPVFIEVGEGGSAESEIAVGRKGFERLAYDSQVQRQRLTMVRCYFFNSKSVRAVSS